MPKQYLHKFRSAKTVTKTGYPMKHKYCAFSLVELLAVLAILAVIAALMLPVLGRGKSSANRTVDISHLRQLGMARTLYRDDYQEAFDETLTSLLAYDSRLLPISKSPNDTHPLGARTAYLESMLCHPGVKELLLSNRPKVSYLSLSDITCKPSEMVLDAHKNAQGWLVAFPIGAQPERKIGQLERTHGGKFLRLNKDGSVTLAMNRKLTDRDGYSLTVFQ
jgi:prepilin-type N-terminal cleavage/methylation domain-containing protein